MRILSTLALWCCGLLTWAAWGAGAHGHFNFRKYVFVDWAMLSLLLFCFGLPVLFFIAWLVRLLK